VESVSLSEDTPTLPENQTIAAIDLGSNSFHLSVVRVVNGTMQPLVRDKRMVQLAQGLDRNGRLSDEAMLRGLEVLRSFAETIQELHSNSVRAVATYTLRKAKNRNEFLRLARKFMPVPIEVISGDEEARLIYQGVAHTTHLEGRRLIVDIGGGSTEFSIGEQFDLLQIASLPLGCVTYTKRWFPDGKIRKKAFKACELAASQRLEIIDRRFKNTGWESAIGCSGTAKAVAQYWESKHGSFDGIIRAEMLEKVREDMISAGHIDNLTGIEEHRRSVMPAGVAILEAIFKRLEIKEMTLSESALREGVLYELTERMRHEDIRERTIRSLAVRYDIDGAQVERVKKTARDLLAGMPPEERTPEWLQAEKIIEWAVELHEIGLHINRRAIQEHSSYIIGNTELPGFSREEQDILALLLKHYRKDFKRKNFGDFTLYKKRNLVMMVAILRLAVLLNIRRLDDARPNISARIKKNQIELYFEENWLENNAVIRSDLRNERDLFKSNKLKLKLVKQKEHKDSAD
jgi:exopolyphosphatase/guanosine-5'-triphosphate,3'-diphosphate pyrophosphatase